MGKLVKLTFFLVALGGVVLLGLSLPVAGRQALSVQTGSMEPALSPGDLVFVKRIPVSDLQIGDIVTYVSPKNPHQTITHRLVDKPGGTNPKHLVLKGDANPAPDAPVAMSRVVGKQSATVPYAGKALDFVHSWPGIILLVYLPALLVVAHELKLLTAYYRSREPYILPEVLARRNATGHAGRRLGMLGIVVVFAFAIAVPARAALMSPAVLAGNNISTATTTSTPGVEAVSIRRVFIACEAGAGIATHVHIILYNFSRRNADVAGWTIRSGSNTLLVLPSGTIVRANSLYKTEAPIISGISYSNWHLTLFDDAGEQKSEHSWEIATNRPCRIQR